MRPAGFLWVSRHGRAPGRSPLFGGRTKARDRGGCPSSSGAAVVVAEQSAETFAALDRAGRLADFTSPVDQLVFQPLMIPFGVVVRFKLGQRFAGRAFAEEEHAVEALGPPLTPLPQR